MDGWIKQSDLAVLLGCATRTIQEYKTKSVIPPEAFNSNSQVKPSIAIPAVFKYLRETAAGRVTQSDNGEILDPVHENAALKRQQRINAEQDERKKRVEADLAEGAVITREDVAIAASFIVSSARSKIIALPTRISSRLQGLSREDIAAITEESNTILEELFTDLPEAISNSMNTE